MYGELHRLNGGRLLRREGYERSYGARLRADLEGKIVHHFTTLRVGLFLAIEAITFIKINI